MTFFPEACCPCVSNIIVTSRIILCGLCTHFLDSTPSTFWFACIPCASPCLLVGHLPELRSSSNAKSPEGRGYTPTIFIDNGYIHDPSQGKTDQSLQLSIQRERREGWGQANEEPGSFSSRPYREPPQKGLGGFPAGQMPSEAFGSRELSWPLTGGARTPLTQGRHGSHTWTVAALLTDADTGLLDEVRKDN